MKGRFLMRTMALGLVGAVSACSARGRTPATTYAQPRTNLVTVRNDNWLDVNLYVMRGGARYRLGTVSGSGQRTFRLPRNYVYDGTVRLLADPIGSPATYTSDQIVVAPGQRIELTIGSRLSMSTFAVWNR